MKRIDTSTRAIDLFGAGKDGFKDGNLSLGVAPTDFNAQWCNQVQEEIASVIEAAGIALDSGVRTQLLQALRGGGYSTAIDTGTANARVVNYAAPVIAALVDGMVLRFKSASANTGAATLNVNGLGAKAVLGAGHSALQGGELVTNGKCEVVWSAILDSFILVSSTGGTQQVVSGTQTGHAVNLGQFAGAPGYQRLPGGRILQWGSASLAANQAVTYPIAFPNAVHFVMAQATSTSNNNYSVNVGGIGLANFSAYPTLAGAATALTIYFLAIGN